MSIACELNYLSDLFSQSSDKTITLGETLIDQVKSINIPDKFSNIEEANIFLYALRSQLTPMVSRLAEVIAASSIDDLGNQSIRRIKDMLNCHEQINECNDLMTQADIDALFGGVSHGGK